MMIILYPDFWILLRMWKIYLKAQWLDLGFLTVTSFIKDVYVIELSAKPCQSSKHVALLFLSPIVIIPPNCIPFLLYRLSVTWNDFRSALPFSSLAL